MKDRVLEIDLPELTPMAHIVWTVVAAALEEKLRAEVHVYSARVAGMESWDADDNKVLWTHLCHPRKIYRWIRRGDEGEPFPEVKMIFNSDSDNILRMEVNGSPTGTTKDILFEVDWLTHTMTSPYAECRGCGYQLTKQEKVLISLLALGRRR